MDIISEVSGGSETQAVVPIVKTKKSTKDPVDSSPNSKNMCVKKKSVERSEESSSDADRKARHKRKSGSKKARHKRKPDSEKAAKRKVEKRLEKEEKRKSRKIKDMVPDAVYNHEKKTGKILRKRYSSDEDTESAPKSVLSRKLERLLRDSGKNDQRPESEPVVARGRPSSIRSSPGAIKDKMAQNNSNNEPSDVESTQFKNTSSQPLDRRDVRSESLPKSTTSDNQPASSDPIEYSDRQYMHRASTECSTSELVYNENSSDSETEVSYMIDFYDRIHFNRVLAKRMASFLNRKRSGT